jgi:ADP-heptose:LPS heptosyltransferase
VYKIINRKKLIMTALADTLAKGLFFPLTLMKDRRPVEREKVRRILVIRTAYVGDVLMTLPMLKPLRDGFPGATITFLTSSSAEPVLENCPHVDEVVTFNPFWFYKAQKGEYFTFIRDFKSRRFDMVIETRADIREIMALVWPLKARYKVSYGVGGGGWALSHVVPYPGLKHKVEYHLDIARYLGCPVTDVDWGVRLTDDEREKAVSLLKSRGIVKPFALVHPGSRLKLKMWRPERYAALIRKMADDGLKVALLGHPSEKDVTDDILDKSGGAAVSLVGAFDMRQLMAVIAEAGLLVCNDSGPLHMAAALGTPVVAVFGPSKSVETAPYLVKSEVVEKDYPCRFRCDESVCQNVRYHGCMEDISVDDVFRAVQKIMG